MQILHLRSSAWHNLVVFMWHNLVNRKVYLDVVQAMELDVPGLEVDIDHAGLGLVEVEVLHHLLVFCEIRLAKRQLKITDR